MGRSLMAKASDRPSRFLAPNLFVTVRHMFVNRFAGKQTRWIRTRFSCAAYWTLSSPPRGRGGTVEHDRGFRARLRLRVNVVVRLFTRIAGFVHYSHSFPTVGRNNNAARTDRMSVFFHWTCARAYTHPSVFSKQSNSGYGWNGIEFGRAETNAGAKNKTSLIHQ